MEDLRALKSVRSDLKIGTVRADIHAVFTDTAAGQTATAFLFDLTAFRQVTLAVEDRFLGGTRGIAGFKTAAEDGFGCFSGIGFGLDDDGRTGQGVTNHIDTRN